MKRFSTPMAGILWLGMHANICVICCILLGSLFMQVVMGEYPCPLCMTQRIAMILCALGQAYILSRLFIDNNLQCKDFSIGHGMTIYAALAGAAMSIRQILLHIVPPDPGYGTPVFGLHIYTWSFLIFCAEILAVGINLALGPREEFRVHPNALKVTRGVFLFLGIIIAAAAVVTFVEEGLHLVLPDNPTSNRLFEDLGLRPPTPDPDL